MATITGLTAARMHEIEDAAIVDADVVSGNLILTKHDGTTLDAGPVVGPPGPAGPTGPASISAIPGEIKLWPGDALPLAASYGKWDWCDGGVLVVATYPKAAANIAAQWRTFAGASDPGVTNFRKPDLRGLVAAGLDAMPGGARANRMTRAVAITIAGRTGEETHVVQVSEMPAHSHSVNDPGHNHQIYGGGRESGPDSVLKTDSTYNYREVAALMSQTMDLKATGVSINNNGGGNAHENVQPTVFVPYIVKLDD